MTSVTAYTVHTMYLPENPKDGYIYINLLEKILAINRYFEP